MTLQYLCKLKRAFFFQLDPSVLFYPIKSTTAQCKIIGRLCKIKDTNHLNSLKDEEFYDRLRGLVDGEGCFIISSLGNNFSFRFIICMHKDETPMINYIAERLKVGSVHVKSRDVNYIVSSRSDLEKIYIIFDQYPLNTSKNLNYLKFKKGYNLYHNRKSSGRDIKEVVYEIINLKNQMNSNRIDFKQTEDHSIKISPY